ncbi:hypothetical protein [Streptomyces sp. B15]|uniref:hypothetical protein n=1 Tax=Streptomyces sp. B15 TaxID=1537797 RepID=UPI001B3947AE|nr:hypothetical protein [Streptomyces sp. B15]MBQ1124284.1 hypothetical protein [Streptomyces sp. B15]
MEDLRGSVNTILYGPTDKLDAALASIRAAGITAHEDRFEPGAISAFHHDGTDDPSVEYVQQCEERVRAAAEGTGFTVDRTTAWESGVATRKLPYNRHTGEWLQEYVDTALPPVFLEEQLTRLAERRGLSISDIELRDPPEFDIPLG